MRLAALALLLVAAALVDAGLEDASIPFVGCFHSKHFFPIVKKANTVEDCIKECEMDKLPLVGMVGSIPFATCVLSVSCEQLTMLVQGLMASCVVPRQLLSGQQQRRVLLYKSLG